MCFTVEIDKKRFPDVSDFIDQLDEADILYMSNECDVEHITDGSVCYRFEFDDHACGQVSLYLAELIRKDYLDFYATNVINANYYGICENDKHSLINNIVDDADAFLIAKEIRLFINENMHIHLGGFVLFRMKEYLENFENEIDFFVEEYIRMCKCKELVNFLRFFVQMNEPEIDAVKLVLKNHKYRLLDESNSPIAKELLDSSCYEFAEFDDEEYIMLNDLISLSPRHIHIYCNAEDASREVVKMISEIFNNRVDFVYI